MSAVRALLEQDIPIGKMKELGVILPTCVRCQKRPATVPAEIGDNSYDLCVVCVARPPKWEMPLR